MGWVWLQLESPAARIALFFVFCFFSFFPFLLFACSSSISKSVSRVEVNGHQLTYTSKQVRVFGLCSALFFFSLFFFSFFPSFPP
jgi:hypothetical protein